MGGENTNPDSKKLLRLSNLINLIAFLGVAFFVVLIMYLMIDVTTDQDAYTVNDFIVLGTISQVPMLLLIINTFFGFIAGIFMLTSKSYLGKSKQVSTFNIINIISVPFCVVCLFLLKPAASPDFAAIIWLARVLSVIWLGLIYFQICISKKFAVINADEKASIAAQKEADRLEDLAEEERIKAEREEKKKQKAEKRAQKIEQAKLEKEQRESERLEAEKAQALAVSSPSITADGVQGAEEVGEAQSFSRVSAPPRLKINILITSGIALVAMLVLILIDMTNATELQRVNFAMILFLFLPAVALQFVFQGIDFIRVFKKYFKLFGVALIVISPFAAGAVIASHVTDANYFLITLGNLNPFGKLNFYDGIMQLLEFVTMSAGAVIPYYEGYTFAGFVQNGVALGYILGVPLYFLIPYLFDRKKYLRWTIKIKHYVCLLIVPISVVVFTALMVYLIIMMFVVGYRIFIGGQQSGRPTGSSANKSVSPAFNHIKRIEIVEEGISTYILDLDTGRSHKIYNFNRNTGYFEDDKQHIYYYDHRARSGDHVLRNIKTTGTYREDGHSTYETDK